MAAHGNSLRQDCLKVAEARVRALTREVGSLKEDLRREVKRRERAVISSREAEELRQEAETRIKQLEYAKRKLEQESFTAEEASRANAAKSRASASCAREELAVLEGNFAQQTAASHHQLQHVLSHLQILQSTLFSPAEPLEEPPLSADLERKAQRQLTEVMQGLSHLGNSLSGGYSCPALPASHSPSRHSNTDQRRIEQTGHQMELERLRTEVALLTAQRNVQQEASCADQAAAEMSSLIPEYRCTLARMKRQVDELHAKLEDAHQQRDSLQQQVAALKKAGKLSASTRKPRRILSHTHETSEEDEDAKRLIKDIRGLKHRCQALEAEADSLGVTNCELQTALADKEQQLQQQRGIIVDLEATINAQSSDIRTALQLVTRSNDRSEGGGSLAHDLVPARHAHRSPYKAALRHESVQHGRDSLHCRSPDILASQQQRRGISSPSRSCHVHSSSMDMLCRDMQQLDAQIADLDLNLASASHRLHC